VTTFYEIINFGLISNLQEEQGAGVRVVK